MSSDVCGETFEANLMCRVVPRLPWFAGTASLRARCNRRRLEARGCLAVVFRPPKDWMMPRCGKCKGLGL